MHFHRDIMPAGRPKKPIEETYRGKRALKKEEGIRKTKPFEETQRGKKALKKEENRKKKEDKAKELEERKNLFLQGLCKAAGGNIVTIQEVGADAGADAWRNAGPEVQEERRTLSS